MKSRSAKHEHGLRYPFAEPPKPGAAYEVARGVLWIRLPMPFELDHINVWALEDGDGYTLVDTGLFTDDAPKLWERISEEYLLSKPVKRVIVTHAHEDHIGTAGWFAHTFGSELWITAEEYCDAVETKERRGHEAPAGYLDFYRAAGLSIDAIGDCQTAYGNSGRWIHALPKRFQALTDGSNLVIGGNSWQVVTGGGHSSRHACLYCNELNLLISGDQVLPAISSNVSVRFADPDDDPLSRWYASLGKLGSVVPDSVLVLPAHNSCFFGLHARLDKLKCSHDAALERLLEILKRPVRIIDTFPTIFRREIKGGVTLRLAVGESLAHLNYLMNLGQVARFSESGVYRYIRASG